MALIIYPSPDADSFISVSDATVVIESYTMSASKWSTLSDTEKEVLLRIAYKDIVDHTDPLTYPTPFPECVGEAQALMAVHDAVNNLSSGTTAQVTGAIKKQKAGPVEREFYDTTKVQKSTSRVPDMAKACLEMIGYHLSAANGLQTRLGKS